MNSHKIPEEIKSQVIALIDNSGITASDFINELASLYKVENTKDCISQFTINHKAYWDSFID